MDTQTVVQQFLDFPRAIHVTIYDMQGGPLPQRLRDEIESAILDVVSKFEGVAWTQKEE
jgi:hypothetical protein